MMLIYLVFHQTIRYNLDVSSCIIQTFNPCISHIFLRKCLRNNGHVLLLCFFMIYMVLHCLFFISMLLVQFRYQIVTQIFNSCISRNFSENIWEITNMSNFSAFSRKVCMVFNCLFFTTKVLGTIKILNCIIQTFNQCITLIFCENTGEIMDMSDF